MRKIKLPVIALMLFFFCMSSVCVSYAQTNCPDPMITPNKDNPCVEDYEEWVINPFYEIELMLWELLYNGNKPGHPVPVVKPTNDDNYA